MDTNTTTITKRTPRTERLTLTVTEAAGMLGISRSLAYEMARDGRLPTVALSARRYVVSRNALGAMLNPAVAQAASRVGV
ncbi:MAG: helix-turn-helix domain-containing protein [Actinomycetota bacterium]